MLMLAIRIALYGSEMDLLEAVGLDMAIGRPELLARQVCDGPGPGEETPELAGTGTIRHFGSVPRLSGCSGGRGHWLPLRRIQHQTDGE